MTTDSGRHRRWRPHRKKLRAMGAARGGAIDDEFFPLDPSRISEVVTEIWTLL